MYWLGLSLLEKEPYFVVVLSAFGAVMVGCNAVFVGVCFGFSPVVLNFSSFRMIGRRIPGIVPAGFGWLCVVSCLPVSKLKSGVESSFFILKK